MKQYKNFKIGMVFHILLIMPQLSCACPFCVTATGIAIKNGIFNPSFFYNLGATLLPFVIFSVISALIYYSLPLLIKYSLNQ